MKKALVKEIVTELKEEEQTSVGKLSPKKRKKLKKKEKKKARIAVIKAANKKKAKLNKQEKKVLDKERISKTEQKDGEDTEKAGNTSDSQSDEKKIIKKKKRPAKHKPLQALKAAAMAKTATNNNDNNDTSSNTILIDETNINADDINNVNNVKNDQETSNEKNKTVAELKEVEEEKKKKIFSPLLSKILNRKKKNLSFRQWEERKIKQIGIEKETEFFMRMCLTEEEKHSEEYFEEQDLKRRKKERDDFRNHYKRRIQDLKESYKIAKRKRRSKIKLALEMIRSEQKTRMKEVNKPKLEKKPWLSAKERRKELERHNLDSRGSIGNASEHGLGLDSIPDVSGGILEAEMLPLAKIPNARWDRLAKPVRPLKKAKSSGKEKSEEEDYTSPRSTVTIERKKKNIEFMALTEDERLSLIGLIPRKTFTAKKYKQEILKLRPQKKERVNGTGDKLGKMRDSIVGRRVIDYSGVFPVLQKNRIEPVKIDPYAYYMEHEKPKNDKMLIKNNFPGPKDSVEAKAWTMYGQQYFTANKLERRLMRLRARVQHDREARKVNLQWIEDSLKNLELYKHDLGYDDCEKAYGALQETNRYLDVQSYGLKAMMDEDVKENLGELQDILKNGEGNRIEINALLNEIKTYITVEFEKGHQELEVNFEHIQKHVNKIVQAFVKEYYIATKTQYNDAIKYHDAGETRRLDLNVSLARDEIQARARLAEIDAWKEEMGKVYKEMRTIPYVDKKKRKKLPPQGCWVCKTPLKFEPKTAEFTFCSECNNFNENKRNPKKIYATKDKRKRQAIKNLQTGVDMACKEIGKAVLNGEMVNVGTFANIRRLERLSEIPTSPQSPGPGWYNNLDTRVLANPYGGSGPRKISLAKPGMLEEHLKEVKFQERLKTYGWSDKLKKKINKIREKEKASLAVLDEDSEDEKEETADGDNNEKGGEENDEEQEVDGDITTADESKKEYKKRN